MVWASPFLLLTSRNPSAPAPPDLLTTMSGRGESLCFSASPAISRAIWSAPPPVPAGTTNSIGLVGSHATAVAGTAISSVRTSATIASSFIARSFPGASPESMSYGIRIEHVYKGPGPVVRARPYRLRAPRRSHGRSGHYFADSAAFVASRRRNGTTAGISHFSHISSTFAWK